MGSPLHPVFFPGWKGWENRPTGPSRMSPGVRVHVWVATRDSKQLCRGAVCGRTSACQCISAWVSVGLFLCALCVSPSVCVTGLSGGGGGGGGVGG